MPFSNQLAIDGTGTPEEEAGAEREGEVEGEGKGRQRCKVKGPLDAAPSSLSVAPPLRCQLQSSIYLDMVSLSPSRGRDAGCR